MVRIPNVIYTKTDKTYKCVDLSKVVKMPDVIDPDIVNRHKKYECIPSGKIIKCD